MPPPPRDSSGLRKATLVFLVLPQMLFFLGWLRTPLSLVVCSFLGVAIWRVEAHSSNEISAPSPAPEEPPEVRRRYPVGSRVELALATVLPALLLTLLSGAGGWGGADSDWLKHDTLLRDLIERPWPVSYETARGPVLLVYYLGLYLPAALIGKLSGGFGYQIASQVVAMTTFAGIVLSAWWLVRLGKPSVHTGDFGSGRTRPNTAGAALWIAAAVFFGFSGLAPLGKILVNLYLRLPAFYGDWSDVEWWAQFAQYSSNAAALFWAPQHAFGGWLPTALVLDDWFAGQGKLEGRWLLYLSVALVWSPFAALGLAVVIGGLLIWRWLGDRCSRAAEGRGSLGRVWWQRSFTVANAAGLLAGTIFALYLLAHFQAIYLPEAYRIAPGRQPVPLLDQRQVPWPVLYLVFVAIEFGGLSLALALHFSRAADGPSRFAAKGKEVPLLAVATVGLLVLPWFHYGFANDLVMRGGLPALFVLQVLLVRMFAETWRRSGRSAVPLAGRAPGSRWPALAAALLLLGGSANVGLEYRRHILRVVAQGSLRDARSRQPVFTLAELQRTVYARPGFDFSRQYLGSTDSIFARYLARRNFPIAAPPEEAKLDF